MNVNLSPDAENAECEKRGNTLSHPAAGVQNLSCHPFRVG